MTKCDILNHDTTSETRRRDTRSMCERKNRRIINLSSLLGMNCITWIHNQSNCGANATKQNWPRKTNEKLPISILNRIYFDQPHTHNHLMANSKTQPQCTRPHTHRKRERGYIGNMATDSLHAGKNFKQKTLKHPQTIRKSKRLNSENVQI